MKTFRSHSEKTGRRGNPTWTQRSSCPNYAWDWGWSSGINAKKDVQHTSWWQPLSLEDLGCQWDSLRGDGLSLVTGWNSRDSAQSPLTSHSWGEDLKCRFAEQHEVLPQLCNLLWGDDRQIPFFRGRQGSPQNRWSITVTTSTERNLGNLRHPDSLVDRHLPRHCTGKEKQRVNHGMISSYSLPLRTAELKVTILATHKALQFS